MISTGLFSSRSASRYLLVSASIIAALLTGVQVGSAQGSRLQHSPPVTVEAETPLLLTCTVEGSASLPLEGRIYFRVTGGEAFDNVEMKVDRYQLTGEIPARSLISGEITYYFVVELDGGALLSLPMGSPTSGEFFKAGIQSLRSVSGGLSDAFVILYPEPGSTLPEGETVIAISILGSAGEIDIRKLSITFDGKDFSKSAKITEDLIVLPLPSVRPGPHSIAITLDRDGKKETLLSWSIKGPVIKTDRLEAGPISANVTTGVGYEEFSSQERKMAFLDGRINGSIGKLKWAGKTYLTSYESKYLQPQNRYLAMLEYGSAALKIGDTQPRFSEFSLWGVRTRGVEFNYHGYAFNLDVAQGEIVRGVEGTSRLDTTVVIDDATGDTLKSLINPGLDSIIVEDVTDISGRFKRNLLAIRPGFPLSDAATLSFSMVKTKDDVKSIDWGRSPKDNLVLGVDLNITAWNRRFIFNTETAVSLYNSDISGGPMADAKSVESMIIVNQFFEPLPTDSTILEGNVDQTTLAQKLFSELVKSSLAHRTSLTLNFLRNELRLGYKTIGRSFRSLGSPTILTDVAGISFEDRIRLLNSRLYLTLGYEAYADNVNGRNSTTTDRNISRASIAYYSPPNYPNLNVGMRIYDRKNDGSSTVTTLPDGTSYTTDTRIDNKQNQYNVGIDESFRWMGFDNLVAVSYTSAVTDDQVNPALATDLSSTNVNLQARRLPWEWNSSLGLTTQSAQNGALTIDYTSLNLGGRYTVIPNKLWVKASIGQTLGDGGNNELMPFNNNSASVKVYKVAYTRSEINGGADYQFNLSHSLSLSLYAATHADDGYTETWGGVRSYNKDAASFVKQDDKSVRLTYNYRI